MDSILTSLWSIPGAKQLRRSALLNDLLRLGYGPHWGSFPSRAAAETFLRTSKKISYDNDAIVQVNLESFRSVHLFDWPVLFLLQQLLHDGAVDVLTDFGGHVGAKYYAYREVMALPSSFRWQVVDLPAVCREGRRLRRPGDESLRYFETLAEAAACDVLLCSGSLQYSDLYIDDILRSMPIAPRTVVLNKVAISDREFHTLEAFGVGRMPYRVVTQDRLARIRDAFGYRMQTEWEIPSRDFVVPHRTGASRVTMIGQAWVRSPD